MAYYAQKDPDLQATEKIYRKIMNTGRDTGRYSSSPSPSVGRKPGHAVPRRSGNTPFKPGHSTPRGGVVLGEKHMNRHFPDPGEALKRTHDGVATHRNASPASTVRTGQSSKKRAVSTTQPPVKPTNTYTRKDKHLTGVPCEKKLLDVVNTDRWNLSYQALRLEKEWTELDHRRSMKRNSEIVQHRIDNMYMMSGSGIRLKPKYDVNESELQQLKDLSRARQVLRDKTKKSQSSSKGRQTRMSGTKSSQGTNNDPSHPDIHIHGDAQKDGANTENPSQADWASDPGSRPVPTPRTPPGNHDNIETDEAGRIINKNQNDDNVKTDHIEPEEGTENSPVDEETKGDNLETKGDNEGQEGEVNHNEVQEGEVTHDEGQEEEGAQGDENLDDKQVAEEENENEPVQEENDETENVQKDDGDDGNVSLNEDIEKENVDKNDSQVVEEQTEENVK